MKNRNPTHKKSTVLIVLDGWGHRSETENNAIYHAHTPVWNNLLKTCPHTLIETSGMAVGLPEGQMGNSEVGHTTLGAGRVVYQNLTRITKAIREGDFFSNPAYCEAIDKTVATGKAVHILGLLSPGGIHSHEDHIFAMIKLAIQRGAKQVYVHAFLDGRDTPPKSALASVIAADKQLRAAGIGRVASLCGRYYAMDRDNRWERIQQAYDLLTQSRAEYHATSAAQALQQAYERGETDEFVKPVCVVGDGEQPVVIGDGDSIIFMNFRADRAREITHAFVDKTFDGFVRLRQPRLASFVMSTEYESNLDIPCAFATTNLDNSIGEYVSGLGLTQLRIAETEKYAHVTFFFSGGREECYAGEERVLVASPKVATYDLQPEMSAPELTERLVQAIRSGKYDLIVCNYANGDMVGHTGIFAAAVKAAEAVDICLGRVAQAIQETGAECLITADHGNVEMMLDQNNEPHTQHTAGPVDLIYLGRQKLSLAENGTLADVAPTLLSLMGLNQPPEMTGRSLIEQG
jgi:2,3-bisphosphoglycerate-independent phosphoglycerate mutase